MIVSLLLISYKIYRLTLVGQRGFKMRNLEQSKKLINTLFLECKQDLYKHYGNLQTIDTINEYKLILIDKPTVNMGGSCVYSDKEIHINVTWNLCNIVDDIVKLYRNVLLHELIHAMFAGDGHCGRWKKLANNMNKSPYFRERYGEICRVFKIPADKIDESLFKYKVICSKCKKPSYYKKKCNIINNPQDYICKCGSNNFDIYKLNNNK